MLIILYRLAYDMRPKHQRYVYIDYMFEVMLKLSSRKHHCLIPISSYIIYIPLYTGSELNIARYLNYKIYFSQNKNNRIKFVKT